MCFARLTRSLDMHGITGAELILKGGYHLTLLAKDNTGLPQPFPADYRAAHTKRRAHEYRP